MPGVKLRGSGDSPYCGFAKPAIDSYDPVLGVGPLERVSRVMQAHKLPSMRTGVVALVTLISLAIIP